MNGADLPQLTELRSHALRQGDASGFEGLELLLENSPVAVMVIEQESGIVRYANAPAIDLLDIGDCAPGTISAQDLWVDPSHRKALQDEVARTGKASTEARLRRRNGEEFDAILNWQVHPTRADEIICWTIDISGQKAVQARLQEQERMLQSILDHLPVALYCKKIDDDFRYTLVNRKSSDIFHCRPGASLGKTDFELFPPELAHLHRDTDIEAARGEKVVEISLETFDVGGGRTIDVRTLKVAVPDAEGVPSLVLGISEDITFKRATERALRNSERRFRELAAHAPLGIYVTDTRGACVHANAHWYEMTGLTAQQASGMRWHTAIHPKDRAAVAERLKALVERQEPCAGEFRFVRPNGRVTWVSGQAVTLVDDDGRITGFLGCCTDISRVRQYEDQLRVSRDLAERAGQAKTDFLARMSHELRTPLNAILGFGQLLELERDNLSSSQREGVNHILTSGEHLLNMVEGALELSSISAGTFDAKRQRVRIGPLVAECLAGVEEAATAEGVLLQGPAGPQPDLLGDPEGVRQVLLNLLTNAVRYNRPGGRVIVWVETMADGRVRVTVQDSGIGIPAADQARLFQPFERGSDNWLPGAGLGLSVCKSLVELMGGEIGFQSEPGTGSRFWFELPAAQQDR